MNKQGGIMNTELIKALRCKECFDLCNVENCRYHLTNTKSGCKCAIKLMATDAADALEAADKRTHFLADNDYPVEGQRVMFWYVDNQQWVSGYYDAPHWEADYGRVDALCWQPLPQQEHKR